MKRPTITIGMKVQRLLKWAWDIGSANSGTDFQRAPVCGICGYHIKITDVIDWDHHHPLALGGKNDYLNIRMLHRACHRKKTSGTKATSYGSDIHAIAKCKRIARGGKKVKHPMPKSQRKMQSRPFP